MQVGHDGRAAIELHQAEAPGQPLAEEQVVAVVQPGFGNQLAAATLQLPEQAG